MNFSFFKFLSGVIYCSLSSLNIFYTLRFFFLFSISMKTSQCYLYCESYCKCLDTFMDCNSQQLSKIPSDFPVWIENLKLNRNLFTEIPLFPLLNNLTSLNLAHNKITFISKRSLENIHNLKVLELNNNIISDISPNSFTNNSYLKILNLNSNNISKIESTTFSGLKNLNELKLNRNKIYQIYKDIFKPINSLQILELNKNQISNIAGLTFQELEQLVTLRLRQNNIDDLADGAFYGLYNLKELCLDYNKLTHISKGWLYGLDLLSHLNVSYNRIQYLNSGWESCPRLMELDLSNNKVQSIEKNTFEHLTQLQSLRLNHNEITYIEEGAFDFIPSLQYLDLSDNHLSWMVENVGGSFSSLKKLNNLYMVNNRILLVVNNAFAGLENLVYLDIGDNEITEIKENPFDVSPHLKTLVLNSSSLICDCSLSWLPNWLKTFPLQGVELSDLRCMHPENMKGKSIAKIPATGFNCSASEDHPQPFITVSPDDVIALVGDNVTLRCGANSSSDSDMEFTWKRNNYRVENTSFRRYASAQTYGVTQFSDLQLIGVTMANSGYYQCAVLNSYGIAYSKSSQLSVLVFPSFVKVPSNVEEKVGNTAKLECAATGYPTPRISWKKDGGLAFPAAEERRMKVEDAFFIMNVRLIDFGVYTCTASNTAGVITANATLTVLESPSFSKKMDNKEVEVGDTIVMECMAVGFPKPTVSWLKDGGSLQISKRHFLTADDQLLIITNSTIDDAGTYECVLTNSLGTEKGSSRLLVLPLSKTEFKYKEILIVVASTIVICAFGTSFIWLIILRHSKHRDIRIPTSMSPIDSKSENSSHSSKDSGTGDSTKRSYQDLLLSAGANNNSIAVIHEERSDSPTSVPEVTLPLLTTFHPIGADANSSLTSVSFIKEKSTPTKSCFAASYPSGTAVAVYSQDRTDRPQQQPIAVTTTTVCSSPSSSNGTQCACLMGTFKKKQPTDLCECLSNNGSPLKHQHHAVTTSYYTSSHCGGALVYTDQQSQQQPDNRYYGETGKRPCSIPIPCHHLSHAPPNSCCKHHPNSYFCLYTLQQHNIIQ